MRTVVWIVSALLAPAFLVIGGWASINSRS